MLSKSLVSILNLIGIFAMKVILDCFHMVGHPWLELCGPQQLAGCHLN